MPAMRVMMMGRRHSVPEDRDTQSSVHTTTYLTLSVPDRGGTTYGTYVVVVLKPYTNYRW
jgi:hypothetical protein